MVEGLNKWQIRSTPEQVAMRNESVRAPESIDMLRDGVSRATINEMLAEQMLVDRVNRDRDFDDLQNSYAGCERISLDYPEYGPGEIAALAKDLKDKKLH
jgi:hypothetical protein